MMGRYVDRRLRLMLRRPTDGRTFAQWDAESQVKFPLGHTMASVTPRCFCNNKNCVSKAVAGQKRKKDEWGGKNQRPHVF